MPPEPQPWDRKDFAAFKDRKHDRFPNGAGDGPAASTVNSRWREPYYFSRASPRRPPPSHHRQSVSYYQLYDENTPSRSDDGFRSSNGRYSGGGGRSSRGSFRQSPYYDGMTSSSSQLRSVAVPLRDVQDRDKNSGGDQRSDSLGSEAGMGWKLPSAWSRQGSKGVRSEVEEVGNGSLDVSVPNLGKETPVRSPVSSPLLSDDGVAKKKPRLTWGQGLAKYEKQKVEGSSGNSGKEQVSESSPKVGGMAGSMSPTTPCSAAPASSPGKDDKPFSNITNVDNDANHHSETSSLGPINCLEEPPAEDHLPPIAALPSILNELMLPEDDCSGDSTSSRITTANKLISFKAGISKELEKTEYEIDLLENELKAFSNDGKGVSLISFDLQVDSSSVPIVETADISSKVPLDSSSVMSVTIPAVGEPTLQICTSGKPEVEVKTESSCPEEPKLVNNGERKETGKGSRVVNNLDAVSSIDDANLNIDSYGKEHSNFVDLIILSNKEAAQKASQVLDGSLATASRQSNIWESDKILLCRKNDVHVREKLLLNKLQLKFKERVLTMKFRAFHHLWKEDLRLLSVRKQRPKSQKHLEICSRSSQSSSQKNRYSIRSRFTLPAGNLTLVPTADIVDFTSKLLSDSQIKLFRNNLKMPALILDEKERRYSRFVTNNNLIEDPPSLEKEKSMINPWTQEEKRIFMEMLATFGKDFAKISSFLTHKTTADCIEFYYKNHKSESFKDVKKQLDLRKQWQCLPSNNYLVTSGKKWNREANAASLDISNARGQHKFTGRFVLPSYRTSKASRVERVSTAEISAYEKETTAFNMLAGISRALSSEAVSSCVTSSISPPDKMNYMRVDRPLTPEVTQTIEEEDTLSDEGCGELGSSVDWTDEDKTTFIRALSMYGKDFVRISKHVGTKSRDQCKIFFSKARKCLGLDQVHPGAMYEGTPTSDANGGRSDDTDDACVAEMDSAICSTHSCSKMDVDFTQLLANTSVQTEIERSREQSEVGVCKEKIEGEGRVNRQESVLEVEKQGSENESHQSDESGKEVVAEVEYSEHGPSQIATDLLSIGESAKAESLAPSVVVDQKLNTQTTSDVPQGVSNEVQNDQERKQQKIDTDKPNRADFSFAPEYLANGNASYIDPKESGYPVPLCNTVLPDPSICSGGSLRVPFINFEEHLHKLKCLSRIHSMNQVDQSSHVLSGYPVQVLNLEEVKETDVLSGKQKIHGKCSQFFVPEIHNEKLMDGSVVSNSRPGTLFSQSDDRSDPQLRPCSINGQQENEQQSTTHRTGDVKLFGQILTNPSSSLKSSSSLQESDSQPLSPKRERPASLKASSCSSSIFLARSESIGQSGSNNEDVPRQSFGFWDGTRIQTGFSSLPESALMVAYQGPLVGGTPFYAAKDNGVSSSSGVSTSFLQPLSVNGKRLERNGFELVSGFQQGGRSAIARLGAGNRNILVGGGGGGGVSDPVAALKMAKLYNGEVESWNRDLNGR